MKRLFLLAMLCIALTSTTFAGELLLEHVRVINDPLAIDLNGVDGARAMPDTCTLANNTSVHADIVQGETYPGVDVTVTRGEQTRVLHFPNNGSSLHRTIDCDPNSDRFYVGYQFPGVVQAFNANKLFGEEVDTTPTWSKQLRNFTPFNGSNRTKASFLTKLQRASDGNVLVEWMQNDGAFTSYNVAVFTPSGQLIGEVGPSDIMVYTKNDGPGWLIFQGTGYDRQQSVPQQIYRLTVGEPNESALPATEVAQQFTRSEDVRTGPVTVLKTDIITAHMVALLTPPRTARWETGKPILDFCPQTRPERARYWLGSEYDPMWAEEANGILQQFLAERMIESNNLNDWFNAEIGSDPTMQEHLQHFNPLDDSWVAGYQQLLLEHGTPTFRRLLDAYGSVETTIIESPSASSAPVPSGKSASAL